MRKSPATIEPYYGRRLLDLQVDLAAGPADHAVTVRLERVDSGNAGKVETIKARYVVGCDGARSTVRTSIGRELHGDSANHAWGVMDVLAVTDFPDIRFKTLIQSAKDGSLLIIPREGGYMVRIYVELAKLDVGLRILAGGSRRSWDPRERSPRRGSRRCMCRVRDVRLGIYNGPGRQ